MLVKLWTGHRTLFALEWSLFISLCISLKQKQNNFECSKTSMLALTLYYLGAVYLNLNLCTDKLQTWKWSVLTLTALDSYLCYVSVEHSMCWNSSHIEGIGTASLLCALAHVSSGVLTERNSSHIVNTCEVFLLTCEVSLLCGFFCALSDRWY